MKTKLYKVFLAVATVAMMLCVSACGNRENDGQTVPDAKETVETEESEEKGSESDGTNADAEESESGEQTGEPEESEPEGQAMGIEQYKEMVEKFALYCEYVYLGYEGRGTVTINEVTVEDDTEDQCRITVYYHEPDLVSDTMSVIGGDGCIGFAIDKSTSQGKVEFWNYLGTEENPVEAADMMAEAANYYDFPLDGIYDFQEGTILSSGSVVADVIGYLD